MSTTMVDTWKIDHSLTLFHSPAQIAALTSCIRYTKLKN